MTPQLNRAVSSILVFVMYVGGSIGSFATIIGLVIASPVNRAYQGVQQPFHVYFHASLWLYFVLWSCVGCFHGLLRWRRVLHSKYWIATWVILYGGTWAAFAGLNVLMCIPHSLWWMGGISSSCAALLGAGGWAQLRFRLVAVEAMLWVLLHSTVLVVIWLLWLTTSYQAAWIIVLLFGASVSASYSLAAFLKQQRSAAHLSL